MTENLPSAVPLPVARFLGVEPVVQTSLLTQIVQPVAELGHNLPAVNFVLSTGVPRRAASAPLLNDSWVKAICRQVPLNNIVVKGPCNLSVIGGIQLCSDIPDVVGQHVLVHAPLGQLRGLCKQVRGLYSTVYVLIPKHARFSTCSTGFTHIADFHGTDFKGSKISSLPAVALQQQTTFDKGDIIRTWC